jgi:flagellar hook-associated protein 2
MPSIISTGIGSGLDIASIVSQLVAAEAKPVETRIGKQEARAQVRLSAYGNLKSALSEFQAQVESMRNMDEFLARKASVSDDSLLSATAGTNALPSSYLVEVVQTAEAQKLTSSAFVDSDTVVGTGDLVLTVGANSFTVQITDENNTLAGIRDAINNAADNYGVAATIVNADAGSYLILSGEKTGQSNAMTITQSGGDGGLASLEYDPGNGLNALTESIAAQDALIRIDGFDVMSETNSFSGAIQGVTIDVFGAAPGELVALDVVNDEEVVRESVNAFVKSYNELVELFDQLTSYDVENQTAGALLGDATARSLRDQIRREMSTAVTDLDAGFSTLSEVGIEIQLDGSLEVDDAKLSTILDADFSNFGRLFAATDGFAVRLADLSGRYLDGDGALETRTAGLNAQIKDIADQRESLNERLAQLEKRLYRQFNALDSLLGQLTQTSNFLSQQLANLPGYTTPGKDN